MGITLITNGTSTAGNGEWKDTGTGELETWTAHFQGTFGGASVSIQARLGSSSSVGVTLDGSATTAPLVKLITGTYHSLRGVVSTAGSSTTLVSLVLAK